MKPYSLRAPDFLRESAAHRNEARETGREPAEKTLFCDQCGGPCLEEDVYSGICDECSRRQ